MAQILDLSNQTNNAPAWQGACSIDTALDVTAADFIKALGYAGAETIYCRLFDDKGDKTKATNRECPARVFDSMLPELQRNNDKGLGVFLVINGGGNSDAETKTRGKARAQFMEIDDLPMQQQLALVKQFPLEPSMIIKTAKSLHTYWILSEGKIKDFRSIQARLAEYFNSDRSIINESRVMRLPGFNHCKGDPVPVQVIKFDPQLVYTQAELADLLPELKAEPIQHSNVLNDTENLPPLYEAANGRHNAIMQLGGYLRRSGLNGAEIENMLREYNSTLPDPLPGREIDKYIADILSYYSKDAESELRAQAIARDIAERKAKQQSKGLLDSFLETIQTEAYKPYTTELSFFDNLLGGGVMRQSVMLLLAAPSTGKTTLAQQIAEAMAKHGKPVLYLNLEMSTEQMLAKAISCRLARNDNSEIISAEQVLQGYKWTDAQRDRITKELQAYAQDTAPNITYLPETMSANFENIKGLLQAVGERAQEKGEDAPAVFVDYLHLITCKEYSDPGEMLKALTSFLKNEYAIKYNTFCFLICATNRQSNIAGKITMESGRDSSALEYTGDYVLSLNYTEIDNGNIRPTDEKELAQLKAAKWRNMTLRVLKHRLGVPGRSAELWMRPAGNIFYDAADFVPADSDRDRIAEQARQRAQAKKERANKESKQADAAKNAKTEAKAARLFGTDRA